MIKCLKKQGFTLVELLVTIILLGIVASIVIYNMTNISNTSKEIDYERYIAAIKSAADVYVTNNSDSFNELYVNKAYIYLTIGDLVKGSLLDENLKNPYTNETIDFEDKIKVNLSNETGDIIFEYPLDKNEEETFLVAISDYVIWGEGYDCMQGAGSYQLSLSDESGDLIMLNNQENIDKYNFKCSLPDGFDPEEAGNYNIQYTWITESGTKKSATRILRVLPQVVPTFKTNYDYDFTQSNWFKPELLEAGEMQDPNCPTGWKCLTYTPYVEGADPESTTLKITKKGNNPKTSEQNVTNGFISTYDTYRVDDGDKTYTLQTIVYGHYNKDYSYTATGSERIKMKLIIPAPYISGDSTNWDTKKNYKIKEPYSPIGVNRYEFKLLQNNEIANNNSEINNTNIFDKEAEYTNKLVNLLGGVCSNRELSYPKIAFRAFNNEGFIGDWTEVDANFTNNISSLIGGSSNLCSSPSNCCYKSGSSCYYNEKVVHISYGGNRFIALERYSDGELLAAYEGVNQYAFSPVSIQNKTWRIDVCDGWYYAHFTQSSPVLSNIINAGKSFSDSLLPRNYTQVLRNKSWAIGYSDATYGNAYTSYIGNVTITDGEKYGKAIYDKKPYWTTNIYGRTKHVKVSVPGTHVGEGTDVTDSYFYAYINGNLTSMYGGSNAYIKPLVQFKNLLYACSGDGSSSNPYVVAT